MQKVTPIDENKAKVTKSENLLALERDDSRKKYFPSQERHSPKRISLLSPIKGAFFLQVLSRSFELPKLTISIIETCKHWAVLPHHPHSRDFFKRSWLSLMNLGSGTRSEEIHPKHSSTKED